MGWDGMGWDGMGWDGMGWDGMGWDGMEPDGMGWDGMEWDGMGWNRMGWDEMGWDGIGWDRMGWGGVGWSGVKWGGVGWGGVGWGGVGWGGVGWGLQVALSEVFHALVAKSGGNSDSGTGMDARDTGDTGDTGYIGDCRDTGCTGNTGDAEHSGDTGDTGGTGDTGNAAAVAGAPFLPRQGVEDWLVKINRKLGRGSEFRSAEAFMGPAPGGGLTLEDFFAVYAMELREGKFWGVAHDLHALGVELPGGMPWVGPYTARFDRVFYSKATLEAVGAMEPLSEEGRDLVAGGDCLPNSWHPSDHLAVAGAFRFR
eukprot:jgi/Undpi1/3776/HiC_scaffold_16.g07145.m1